MSVKSRYPMRFKQNSLEPSPTLVHAQLPHSGRCSRERFWSQWLLSSCSHSCLIFQGRGLLCVPHRPRLGIWPPCLHGFPCLSNRPRWRSGPCRGLTPQPQNNCCSVLGSLGHSSVPGGCPGASKALLAGFPSPGCSAPPSALTTLPLSSYRAVLLFVAFLTPGLSFPFLKIIHVLLQPEGPQKDRKGHRKSSLLFPSSPFKSL